jgi:hypothetical protein
VPDNVTAVTSVRESQQETNEMKDYIARVEGCAAAEWTRRLPRAVRLPRRQETRQGFLAVAPLQCEQLKHACNATNVAEVLVDVLPLRVGWDSAGQLHHPLDQVAGLTVDDMTELLSKNARKVIFALLPSFCPLLAV